ncbi:yhhn family protein [Tritrichomonas foetus]|uniref:Yhhn family protein n=1 Tax=Tritrichomonas foetus TaxID=1144522 RepID=A0A1J4K691_9EUKA|nr:yhhn family protein [Tritrichomonas foetus]|eukprot:OHT04989.1 yhhn family protein [Tritrichomonas foetus]
MKKILHTLFTYSGLILYLIDAALIMLHFNKCNATGADYLTTYYGVLKGLLLISLGIYYRGKVLHAKKLEVLYLIFSFLGDVLLMSYNFQIYIFGGVFFLLSHIVLIILFSVDWKKVTFISYVFILPGFLLHAIFLYPHLIKPEMQAINFLIYSLILEIAAASSIGRMYKFKKINSHFTLIAVGYFFFLVSDFFLLYKEITQTPTDFKHAIMGTYIIAQFLIVKGLTQPPNDKSDD